MADLPVCVLTNIFKFQSYLERKYTSKLVCRQWKDAVEDPVLWKDATAFICPSAAACTDIKRWAQSLVRMGLIRFKFHKSCSRPLIFHVCLAAAQSIKDVSLSGSENIMTEIITLAPNLEMLDLSNWSANSSDALVKLQSLPANALHSLNELNIGHTYINVPLVMEMYKMLCPRNIKSLGLSNVHIEGEKGISKHCLISLISQFQNLKSIDLSFLNETSDFFDQFALLDLPNLEVFQVTSCGLFNSQALASLLKQHPNLRVLKIDKSCLLGYDDVILMISTLRIKPETLHLKNLVYAEMKKTKLDIGKCFQGKNFSLIKSLDLSFFPLVNDNVVEVFCHNFIQIEDLSIACCKITDHAIHMISRHLTTLKKLDISSNRNLTDGALIDADGNLKTGTSCEERKGEIENKIQDISNLQELEWLSLDRVKITEHGIAPLCKMKNLKTVSLQLCAKISPDAITELCCQLPLLSELNIASLKITDEHIELITKEAMYLSSLDISRCLIGDDSLEFIGENCHCLRYLNLSNCVELTESKVRDFVKSYGSRLFDFQHSKNIVWELV
eukprot:Seg205.18 transcript_id=Seg205.18/GoldUCD/mRNA.D3Y31 product="F-box/LRR-repeat protein 14" protein_id=Seg205.18/GoldUCD/D3Y31